MLVLIHQLGTTRSPTCAPAVADPQWCLLACCHCPAGLCVRVLTSQTSCVTCLGFSPDGQQLAAGTDDGTVAVYDLGSARRCAPAMLAGLVNCKDLSMFGHCLPGVVAP